jgi:hypothetical protein
MIAEYLTVITECLTMMAEQQRKQELARPVKRANVCVKHGTKNDYNC